MHRRRPSKQPLARPIVRVLAEIFPCRAFALGLLLGLVGCGTLAGRHQHLSIDSSPRGVAVVDEEGEPIGRTPVFHRIARDSTIRLGVPTQAGAIQPLVTGCSYRWLISPLENAPLLLFAQAPWLWPVGLSVDWFSGAAYACPERVLLPEPMVASAKVRRVCHRYLIMGPQVLGERGFAVLNEHWLADMKTRESCAETVIAGRRRGRLVRTELDDVDDDQRQRLYRLGYESGATHLARLRYGWHGDEVKISARVIDLHRQSPQDAPPVVFRPTIADAAALRPGFFERHLRGNLSLIPDTVGFGVGGRRGRLVTGPPAKIKTTKVQSSLIVRLATISHPDAYRPWDLDFNFGPAFAIEFFEKLLPKISVEDDGPGLNFNRFALYGDASGTLHTPMGSLRLAIGLGGAYYRISEPAVLKGDHLVSEATLKLAYTAFFTDSLYGQLFAEVGAPQMKDMGYETQINELFDAGIVVGYYFPQIGDWARSWF